MIDPSKMTWKEHQAWEREWHNSCVNSYWEETKQQYYARKMGLTAKQTPDERFPIYDLEGKSVLDVGGGAYSLLLKCQNISKATVVDPLDYPQWTMDRYKSANIEFIKIKAEDMDLHDYDEVWMYNCLQHTEDPEKIVKNCLRAGKKFRIFEWIDRGVMIGHPQDLKRDKLDEWIGQKGRVDMFILGQVNYGSCYFGEFDI